MSLLELVRRAVRQQTNSIGEPVTNLFGAVAGQSTDLAAPTQSEWQVLALPGTRLPGLDEYFANYAADPQKLNAILPATQGQIVIQGNEVAVYAARGLVTMAATTAIPIAVAGLGSSMEYALYVDGVLNRRGAGDKAWVMNLTTGEHLVELLIVASTFALALPTTVRVSVTKDKLDAPVWESATATYADPRIGTPANKLRWYNNHRVGGWSLLRRELTVLGDIVKVGTILHDRAFAVDVAGNVETSLQAGAGLFAGTELMGTVVSGAFDGVDTTQIVVTLTSERAELNEFWQGRTAAIGMWREIARIMRWTGGNVVEYLDTMVKGGDAYEYALQAFGLFDFAALSPLSDSRFVRAGDLTPPGDITLKAGYPKSFNKLITVRFTTPVDEDYAGVMTYAHASLATGTATSATTTTLVDTAAAFTALPATAKVLVTAGTAVGQERTVLSFSATALTVDTPWDITPDATSTYIVYTLDKVVTDYGVPNADDEFHFGAQDAARYYFRTFDNAGNEQDFGDAVYWDYDPVLDDVFSNANVPPQVGIKQLTDAEVTAVGLTPDFNVVVLELSASDAVDGTVGVTIDYKKRGDLDFTTGLPASAAADALDAPLGTRKRLVTLNRATFDNWMQVRAMDQDGLLCEVVSYTADYDIIPEVSDVNVEVDTTTDIATVTVIVDDDTKSYQWRLDTAAWTTVADTSSVKTSEFAFDLLDGERKTLQVKPFSEIGATGTEGPVYEQVVERTPRTSILIESKTEDGASSATVVRVTFLVSPAIPDVAVSGSGTATSGTATTLTDTGKAWTPEQFAPNSTTREVYYVRTVTGAGAGQLRKIVTNSTTTLSVEPNWDDASGLPTSGTTYVIQQGATLYRRYPFGSTSAGGFIPTWQPVHFTRSTEGDVLEFFSVLSGVAPEGLQRALVDGDDEARILRLDVTQSAANTLHVSLGEMDDDVKRWRCYVRRGQWPTGDGTLASAIDNRFIRFDAPTQGAGAETSFSMIASGTVAVPLTWYVIAVPVNSVGDAGPWATGSVAVTDANPNAGTLANLTVVAQDDGTTASYNKVQWQHNAYLEAAGGGAGTWTAKVYAYRADLGPSTEVEVTSGLTRYPRLDAGVDFVNAGDTDTVTGYGSILHNTGNRRSTATAGSFRTWYYTVELWFAGSVQVSYTVQHSDYYERPVPQFSTGTATATEINGGACQGPNSKGLYYPSPERQIQVTWGLVPGTANDTDYETQVWFTNTAVPNFSSLFSLYSLPSSQTSCIEYGGGNCVGGSGSPHTEYRTYRVQLVRKADSAVIATIDSNTLSNTVGYCLLSDLP
jgi:hypothetical protein